jgi:CxxC motif-containing protein (DUF1111 family)
MTRRLPILLLAAGLQAPLMAQNPLPPDAPPGFDTPTLAQNPGSASSSNGILEKAGDTFQLDQQIYETIHDASTGLGPVYNGRSCAECHQNPVSGGASQFTELRAGHFTTTTTNGVTTTTFANPTVTINDGLPNPITGLPSTLTGRSIVNDRALEPGAQEKIPAKENLRELRAALSTLGDGFVEAVPDQAFRDIAKFQSLVTHGKIHGEAVEVTMFEAPVPPGSPPNTPAPTRVGRFGWKDQHASLLSFVADAYVNEMGVTNPLRLSDGFTVGQNLGKITTDPEDKPDPVLNMADIDHFAAFIRGTKVPPRDANLQYTNEAMDGEKLFVSTGCALCHFPFLVTAPADTVINGGQFKVPAALGNKTIHPFGDYLLHDIGTAGGIVQTMTAQDTAFKFRTAPLWGLRMRPRYMHDLQSLTLKDAIERHQGEAEHVTHEFNELSDEQKQHLFTFLNSL